MTERASDKDPIVASLLVLRTPAKLPCVVIICTKARVLTPDSTGIPSSSNHSRKVFPLLSAAEEDKIPEDVVVSFESDKEEIIRPAI